MCCSAKQPKITLKKTNTKTGHVIFKVMPTAIYHGINQSSAVLGKGWGGKEKRAYVDYGLHIETVTSYNH